MAPAGDPSIDDADASSATPSAAGSWRAQFLFLAALVAFLASLLAFVADLVTGHDVLRSLVVNVVAALGLVGWAAVDTLTDPESAVDSRGGAAGTALLLHGLYLLGAALVVAMTSLWHSRLDLALVGGAAGVVFVLVGFLIFPRGTVLDDSSTESETSEESGQAGDSSDE